MLTYVSGPQASHALASVGATVRDVTPGPRHSGRLVTVFDRVEADPSKTTLLAAVRTGQLAGAQSVVGFGGGSPMDVAKLAAYLIGSGDELDSIWGVGKALGIGLPLALVPTTAGTGSEVGRAGVITDEATHTKKVIFHPLMMPRIVIADPELTVGMSIPEDYGGFGMSKTAMCVVSEELSRGWIGGGAAVTA